MMIRAMPVLLPKINNKGNARATEITFQQLANHSFRNPRGRQWEPVLRFFMAESISRSAWRFLMAARLS